jgi:hypothetical protein
VAVPPTENQARIVHLDIDRSVEAEAVPEEAEVERLSVNRKEEGLDGETGLVCILGRSRRVSMRGSACYEQRNAQCASEPIRRKE